MDVDQSERPQSYWPAEAPPDEGVVIAYVVVDSVLGDTNTVVAAPDGAGRIRLSALTGEGQPLADLDPGTVDEPLSLGELIELIDSADLGGGLQPGLVYGILEMNSMIGSGDPSNANFIEVSSEMYPALCEHYERQILRWVS